jgi:hypothetical protein
LYSGTYSWNSPPKSVGQEGFSITLSVRCETGAKQTMATGIQMHGDFDFVVSASDRTKAVTDVPANCAAGQSVDNSSTVHVLPREDYREGETIQLRIEAFWGLGVTYRYTAGKPEPPPPPIARPEEPPAPPPAQQGKSASLGCYKDTSAFDLDGYLERSPQNTPQRCISICNAKGFAYAGVQYGESCLCGNSYGRYGAANNCDYPCTGDSGQICGGYSANSVYPTGVVVAAAPPKPPPPEPPPPVVKAEPPPPPVVKAEPPAPPVSVAQATGDCDGDGRVTELDARCALEMSVRLAPVQMAADMDDSNDVTSRDAVVILQRAVGN